MKIVILSRAPLSYYAGIPRFCSALLSGINQNFTVINYSLSSASSNPSTTKCHNASDLDRKFTEITYRSQFVYKTLAVSLGYAQALFSLALDTNERSVVFHYQHPDPFSAVCIILAKLFALKRVRILITWHADIYRPYFIVAPILLAIDLCLFYLADQIVYPTNSHFKSSFARVFPCLARKISFISFGLFPKHFSADTTPLPVCLEQTCRFLSIGRLVPYKGYEIALKAFALLSQKNVSFRYDIVGSGPLYSRLLCLISQYHLEANVFIHTGITDEVKSQYLTSAHCFLLPSISQAEAFGLVQLEAFAYGLPVVNTFLGNGVNFVAPPSVACTVPARSSKFLAGELYKFCTAPDLLAELSILSRSRSEFFSLEIMCQQYSDLFAALI